MTNADKYCIMGDVTTTKGNTMIMMREKTTMWSTCRMCKDQVEMKVYAEDVAAWENGELIQDAMTYLTDGEREVLISGTCDSCWEKMFPSD